MKNDQHKRKASEYDSSKWICVAAIMGAFGVQGDLRLKPFTAQPENCATYGPLYDENGALILTPDTVKVTAKGVIMSSKEGFSREQVEALKGTRLYVLRSVLPDVEEDEYYYTDLLGLKACDQTGHIVGRIKAVHDFGSGDVLEIQPQTGRSWFHPFTKQAVPRVDIKAGIVNLVIEDDDEAPI